MHTHNFIIGTRKSLLAVTQCTLLKEHIESLSDVTFSLKKMVTEGDQKTDKPLWQMDGKDFFTKELDSALLNNEIDMVVHSYKDLGSERPKGIKLAAIGKRSYAHDILLIKNEKINQIAKQKEFIVGTSSPRRQVNITKYLKDYLPNSSSDLEVKCQTLRGNVNTRIQKLLDNKYDAIVLAMAGLERLALKSDSLKVLKELTQELTFMILPQRDFTSAASQGSLAVEVNEKANEELLASLDKIHHSQSQKEIEAERKCFQNYGGGCHLAVGIYAKEIAGQLVIIEKGEHAGKEVNNCWIQGQSLEHLRGNKVYTVLGDKDFLITKSPITQDLSPQAQYFVTSSHCFHNLKPGLKLWAAGSRTMKKLASQGHWVFGCADSLGHDVIKNFSDSAVVKLLTSQTEFKVLSHDRAESVIGDVIPCYKREVNESVSAPEDFIQADIYYWNSFFQYQSYVQHFPFVKEKLHCCGLGKTFSQFKESQIDVTPIAGMKVLKNITN